VTSLTGFLLGVLACALLVALTRGMRAGRVRDDLARQNELLDRLASEASRVRERLAATEEALAQKEQLAMVGELAAVIAHEVRNPLAIISNAVAGLRKEVISREDHATLLSILDEEARRLNRLVTDLLRYARPINVQRTQFAVRDLLERAVSPVRSADKGIAAAVRVECDGDRIWGDSNLLRQVFDNLVDNAVQAMGGGPGTLTVRIRAASVEGVDGVSIDVIDTGEGMDAHVRARARDPFFTTRPSGTGLGLAIVDRIVAAHRGRLSIDSHAGEGTTVTVFLPLGSPSEPPPPIKRVITPQSVTHTTVVGPQPSERSSGVA
jgi:signal transduction histidine kinase